MPQPAERWPENDDASRFTPIPESQLASTLSRDLWLDRATGRRSTYEHLSLDELGLASPDVASRDLANPDFARPFEGANSDRSLTGFSNPEGNRDNRPDRISGPAKGESLAALMHDARNMVSALDLYCDLLAEPEVLAASFRHYASELRLVASASRRLLEKLATVESVPQRQLASLPPLGKAVSDLQCVSQPAISLPESLARRPGRGSFRMAQSSAQPVESLAAELQANRNLIAALAGPAITVGLSISGGNCPIAMTGDDLTRVLVNLARNAAEAMPSGGHIQIALEETADRLCLSVADSGPGIPELALEAVFAPGYSCHVPLDSGPEIAGVTPPHPESNTWPVHHSGLGLSIVRSIVAGAGGRVWAANRTLAETESPPLGQPLPSGQGEATVASGAILHIEFPRSPASGQVAVP